MGESVAEATITNWLKEIGETINEDEPVLEIATDKVDSEVSSEVSGILTEKLFQKDDLIQVGQTIAIIETTSEIVSKTKDNSIKTPVSVQETPPPTENKIIETVDFSSSSKFLSPLVRNIARKENISLEKLEKIKGTGKDNRVTKNNILDYLQTQYKEIPVIINGQDEIVEMDRMRKLISGYMIASLQTSAHVQSFIEVDVTTIWKWREKNKSSFEKQYNEKLTFTPIFMEAVAKSLRDYPMMNISIDGNKIIKKQNINLGMATALPNGNLIVPVIRNADQLTLVQMAKAVNDLGNRAKTGKLKPDDTQGGTYTVTNIGSFGSVFGTPIINQPEVGIIAIGAIRKMPAVIETPEGDFIGIRNKLFLSHSYDHRIVDGALGGAFVKRVAEYLENFDFNRSV